MERERLEELTLDQLKEETSRFKLPLNERRDTLINAIMSHFERHGPKQDFGEIRDVQRTTREGSREIQPLVERQVDQGTTPQDMTTMFTQMMA